MTLGGDVDMAVTFKVIEYTFSRALKKVYVHWDLE